ncbi:50S ribosomal protein L23 [Patescibacteria group bacterium]|nr:50S ribosomal protein L23 [Patescibacteria group bacterium]MBU1703507.1 50S ribosomal protein L23 [Patescibacteria group bacterium]MBU1953414.1 50S ribosomal protein L23 [Patescibacteria group bacterium]
MKALYTIIKPIVTEKAIKLSEKMTYSFYVNSKATKIDVKMAVKELYGQNVDSVKMTVSPAKTRGLRNTVVIKRKKMKKAIVTLKGKKKIDLTKVTKEPKK